MFRIYPHQNRCHTVTCARKEGFCANAKSGMSRSTLSAEIASLAVEGILLSGEWIARGLKTISVQSATTHTNETMTACFFHCSLKRFFFFSSFATSSSRHNLISSSRLRESMGVVANSDSVDLILTLYRRNSFFGPFASSAVIHLLVV